MKSRKVMTENGGLVSGFLAQTLLMTEARTGGQFLGRPGVALCSTTSLSTSMLVLFCGCVSQSVFEVSLNSEKSPPNISTEVPLT